MMSFGPLAAEIVWQVWGSAANFKRFLILASLFSRFDYQHSTEGTMYIWLGGHHVGHQPTF